MRRDQAARQGPWGAPDVVQFGSPREPREPRGPRGGWRWPGRLAVAVLLAAGVTAALLHRSPSPATRPAVQVTEVGHRLLGVRSGWQLLGLGPDGVVRIQLDRGRITRTAIPALPSSGPGFFVAGPHEVGIRPLDIVPGYLVPDGGPARSLPAALSHGGVVVPGPRPGQVWVVSAGSRRAILDTVPGGVTVISVPLPPGPQQEGPDGRGGLLLSSAGGSFSDIGPTGTRRAISGTVLAVGPARWLVVACRTAGHCHNEVIVPAAGAGRVLPGPQAPASGSVGVVSPDGLTAALFTVGSGLPRLELIDLSSGISRILPVSLGGALGSPALAWSPDSRWLFTVAADGQLRAVDPGTGQLRGVGVPLPPLTRLAIRNAPAQPR